MNEEITLKDYILAAILGAVLVFGAWADNQGLTPVEVRQLR